MPREYNKTREINSVENMMRQYRKQAEERQSRRDKLLIYVFITVCILGILVAIF